MNEDDPPAGSGRYSVQLSTKLSAPAIRSQLIDRSALLATLSAEPRRKLTLLSAPAGWGKTTLLGQWLSAGGPDQFGWLTLDSSDNDPGRFWTCVLTAIGTTSPGVGAEAFELLALGADHVRVVIPTLLNELAAMPHRIVLVLDDYHLVENPIVHEQLSYLVEHMPGTFRLVIATRSDPMLSLARLRVRGDLLEIRTEDLRFLVAEAHRFLTDVLDLDLTDEQVNVLLGRTEGWAAGLYLAALSLAGRDDTADFIEVFAGDNRHVVDYLIAEVLDGQPSPRRDFLLKTSVLRRLTGALCDATLEIAGSATVLVELERENLFLTPLDTIRHWYRYHQLFAELLRAQLHLLTPETVAGLHRRAAAWLTDEGLIDDAVHHLAAAGDTRARAELIATRWAAEFNRGHLSSISSWLDGLPADVVMVDPRLSMARAWNAVNHGRIDAMASWIDTAAAALGTEPSRGGELGAQLDVLRALRAFKIGDLTQASEAARRVIGLGVDDPPADQAGAYCIEGAAQYYLGNLEAAQAAFTRAASLAERNDDRRARVYALAYLALIAGELGRMSDTQTLLDRAAGPGTTFAPGEHSVGMTIALLATAVLRDRHGDTGAAFDAADMAVEGARATAGLLEVAKALAVRAHIEARRGGYKAATEGLSQAAATLAGHVDQAVVDRILASTRVEREVVGPATLGDEQLTDKEVEVLRLLATPLSRREIGERIFVSLNTVKTHQRRVYRKLGVDRREDAVDRGRELGLI